MTQNKYKFTAELLISGTNTIPTFSLFQGKKSDIKLTRRSFSRKVEGSDAISERSEERLVYQTFNLKKGAKVRGGVCSSQFVPDSTPRPGIFVAATTNKSELIRISDNVKAKESNTSITCNGCLFSHLFPTLKKCYSFGCTTGNASCFPNFNKYAFSVNNRSGDYYIGYIYLTRKTNKSDVTKEPSWAELLMSNTIKQKQYIKTNSSWIQLSSNKMEAKVHNFSNSDTLLVAFSKPLANSDLPLTNIDILYRCNPTIWLYLVLFLLIPLVLIGIVWAVIYFLIRRGQTGSGLLASEDE